MDSFEAWLAQMPREGVRQRIARLEKELTFLRGLEQMPVPQIPSTSPAMITNRPPVANGSSAESEDGRKRRRLSPERVAIIETMRQQPNGMSPIEVARALGKDPNPIQTAMSRMAHAGQLVRVEQGNYRLPPHLSAARLLADEGAFDGVLEEVSES